jgi:NADH-quinone oxidoreductase subunit C
MTDEPKNPPESESSSPSESAETRRAQDSSQTTNPDKAPGSPRAAAEDAGTLPPPPDADTPRPTPESQAALTGKAPSGSSTSGTTVPASSGESAQATPPAPGPKPAAPPANETPEEKRARLERTIAEAKARKEAAAAAAAQAEGGAAPTAAAAGGEAQPPGGKSPEVGDPLKSPSQADLERAAKIAEAKARAAALKEAAGAKPPAVAAGAEKPAPAAPVAAKPAATAPAGVGAPKPPVKKKDEGPKPAESPEHPLFRRLRGRFGESVEAAFTFLGQLSVHVRAGSIVEVCEALRDDAETPFNYLSDLTCVHWPERDESPYELVYNLFSIPKNARVRLKAYAGEEGIESVTSVWPTANWMEREVFDLFGVTFRNHPDLRRLLLPKDWDGHPLRKDYPLEFMENRWTALHLPEFSEVQQEQLQQRRAYGLEILQTPDERRVREIFRDGRDPLPKEHK